ncbi:MAG: type VI secretion system protein TssA [Phycisphaeraceae bacterium]|nr:type VI secretion system protein TssA [Phycisphaerae bacterium]MBX3393084.1 type VI secretion system protein TssA [Phycisphaeraceae bacterium]
MSEIDVARLLEPVSAEQPAGDDLRYDQRYMEVMRAAEGTPEDPFSNTPAVDPDWRTVRDGTLELLIRTKDLRVALLLAASELRMSGYPGLVGGLAVLRGLVERYWDVLYPQLDPDDGYDPTERVNILASLLAPPGTMGDSIRFIEGVRDLPLAESRMLGRVGYREILVAMGELPPREGEGAHNPDASAIDAVFRDVEPDALLLRLQEIDACIDHVKAIEAILTDKVGHGRSVDFSPLRNCLSESAKQIRKRLPSAPGTEPGEDDGSGSLQGAGQRIAGEVGSRDDVLLAFGKIVRYYDRVEPSSPVTLFMKCAEQMVGKSFADIVRVLTPDAVAMLVTISTPPDQNASS